MEERARVMKPGLCVETLPQKRKQGIGYDLDLICPSWAPMLTIWSLVLMERQSCH